MATPKRLKVFRTPIGFHDAYVAAPSQKAALEAWGSSTNLFTQGAAELVTDPELTKAALGRPGEVVRVHRGSAGEHVRALGKTKKKDRPTPGLSREREGRKLKRAPRPSSRAVDRAEEALAVAEAKHGDALAVLTAEIEALDKRRRKMELRQRRERERLGVALDEARERYRSALEKWAE